MKNKELRERAKQKGVYLWEVARKFGITDSHFTRRLREEFTEEEKKLALAYVDEIENEHQKEV